jgi:biopolymer transport protein TolR
MAFGRFSRASHAAPISEINVTPLVDVMMVLLVIFMLAAPLLASAIRLDLPQAAATQPVQGTASLSLALTRDGQLLLREQVVSRDALLAQLQAVARARPDTEVQLRADREVPYGRVVELLGLAQRAGLSRVGFVALPQADAATP